MKILAEIGNESVAKVYIGETYRGNVVEFVESTPTYDARDKWVLIISSLNGCPVGCKMCDAGFFYRGKLDYRELMEQIEYPIARRWDGEPQTKKFKVQFARMGEPTFNPAVLDVLRDLDKYENMYPSLSTVAPVCVDRFFEKLLKIKKEKYATTFQMQFSIHTMDERQRDEIIPVRKWSFEKIAKYGRRFYEEGGRKITLNFALASENIVDAKKLSRYFDAEYFLIKITPINPTISAMKNNMRNDVDVRTGMPLGHRVFVEELKSMGYDVIISIGDIRENEIGSNCGMYILKYLRENGNIRGSYTFAENLGEILLRVR